MLCQVLLDGGILVNNPTAIAVHESRQLWPDVGFQCVVSLGTGRCQPMEGGGDTTRGLGGNWGGKLRSVINSATDTEGIIHTISRNCITMNNNRLKLKYRNILLLVMDLIDALTISNV